MSSWSEEYPIKSVKASAHLCDKRRATKLVKRAAHARSSLAGGKRQRHCSLSSQDLLLLFAFPPYVCALADPHSSRLERRQNAAAANREQISGGGHNDLRRPTSWRDSENSDRHRPKCWRKSVRLRHDISRCRSSPSAGSASLPYGRG